jgi:hypothetical protein
VHCFVAITYDDTGSGLTWKAYLHADFEKTSYAELNLNVETAVAGVLNASHERQSYVTAFLFDVKSSVCGGMHIYHHYEPAGEGGQFLPAPVSISLTCGDPITALESVIPVVVGRGPRKGAPGVGTNFHFLGLVVGDVPGEPMSVRRWALMQSVESAGAFLSPFTSGALSTGSLSPQPCTMCMCVCALLSDWIGPVAPAWACRRVCMCMPLCISLTLMYSLTLARICLWLHRRPCCSLSGNCQGIGNHCFL